MPRRRWGTASRLAGFLAAVLLLLVGLVTVGLLRAYDAQSTASTLRSLNAELRNVAVAASGRPVGQSLPEFAESYLRTQVLPAGESVIITLRNGSALGSDGSGPLLQAPQIHRWIATAPSRGLKATVSAGGTEWDLVAAPLVASGRNGQPNQTVGTVIAALDTNRFGDELARVRAVAIGEAVAAVLAAALGSWLLLRRQFARIRRVTNTAARIASGDLDRRLREADDGDEVGELARTFDGMADRLSATLAAQRRLLSDVSHQLRTPLTVVRGHLEVLERLGGDPRELRETLALVLDEIDHMKAEVERLLLLGHALEPDFLRKEPVDLRSFCLDLIESARVIADRRWQLEDVPDLVIDADPAKLRGALLNLLDNAVHATSAGDTISMSATRLGADHVGFAVEDSGPGFPVSGRAALLERFSRPGVIGAPGSGLGLTIAQAVAEAHGGRLQLGDSELGGAKVVLEVGGVITRHPLPEPPVPAV